MEDSNTPDTQANDLFSEMMAGNKEQPVVDSKTKESDQKTVEEKAADAVVEKSDKDPFYKSWDKLTEREKKLTEREGKIKESSVKLTQFEKDLELLDTEPLAFLEKYGKKVDDVIKNGLKPLTPEQKKLREIEKQLDKDKAEKAEKEQQDQTAKEKQEESQAVIAIGNFIKDNANDLEVLSSDPSLNKVLYDRCNEIYKATGKEPNYLEEAKKLEAEAIEKAEAFLKFLNGIKKLNPNKEVKNEVKSTAKTSEKLDTSDDSADILFKKLLNNNK
jgi:hypothetical protein